MSVIETLFTGKAQALLRAGHAAVMSGIVKMPQDGKVWLSFNGLQGDEQGDRVYHGGPEKALHHYAAENYALWQPLTPGTFGENISTFGMTEQNVHIGDIYQVGSAVVQVSQGRQPCWRLNRRLQRDDAALLMQNSGATGWYYRVLCEGWVAQHDKFELIQRLQPDWPMQRLISALFSARLLRDEWQEASQIGQLSSNWRATFARRVQLGQVEDWTRRLYEP